MTNPEHAEILEDGTKAWDSWRLRNPEIVPDLSRANLNGANLSRANLNGANLSRAILYGANLSGAILYRTNLNGADLNGADLYGADLYGANLYGTNLYGTNLSSVLLPAPTTVLLANWGRVSDELCIELMRYDAANHPYPTLFDDWARGGSCPYSAVSVRRCANFKECQELWSPGPAKSAYELMVMLLREKCITDL